MRICLHCRNVEGIGWWESCLLPAKHQWVQAVVKECPFVTRSPTGLVTSERRRMADRDCESSVHHFGDLERRHFAVPYMATIDAARSKVNAIEVSDE